MPPIRQRRLSTQDGGICSPCVGQLIIKQTINFQCQESITFQAFILKCLISDYWQRWLKFHPDVLCVMRINSPFTEEQSSWVILLYGEVKNCLAVRRKFRKRRTWRTSCCHTAGIRSPSAQLGGLFGKSFAGNLTSQGMWFPLQRRTKLSELCSQTGC